MPQIRWCRKDSSRRSVKRSNPRWDGRTALAFRSPSTSPGRNRRGGGDHSANFTLYPELQKKESTQRGALALKSRHRHSGQPLRLVGFRSVLCGHCVDHQADLKGPVLFRQERMGQYGKPFTFLKFRSMRRIAIRGFTRNMSANSLPQG